MSFGCSCQVKLTLRGSGLVTLEFLTIHCLPGLARPSTPTLNLDFGGKFDIGDLEVRISCVILTDKPRELRQPYDVSFRLIECGWRVKYVLLCHLRLVGRVLDVGGLVGVIPD